MFIERLAIWDKQCLVFLGTLFRWREQRKTTFTSSVFLDWETAEVRFHGFAELDATRGQGVRSSKFTHLGHEWRLCIHPGGHQTSDEGMVGIHLCNMSKKSIKINFSFSIKASNGRLQAQKTFQGTHFGPYGRGSGQVSIFGMRNYAQRTTILDSLIEGALVIVVKLKTAEPSKKPPIDFVPENPSACKIIQDMFMDEQSADVVFDVVGERRGKRDARRDAKTPATLFYAHRFILQQCSTTLADLCGSGENQSCYVPIPNESPDIFRHLLHYIYGGTISEEELKKNAKQIMEAADKYGVPYLKLEAEVSLVNSMTVTMENVMDHLLYADAKNCALFKEHVMDYMVKNKLEIIEKVSFVDAPGALIADVFTAFARAETNSEGDESNLCTMRISDLRRKLYEKGLDVDGSREALIASLKDHS